MIQANADDRPDIAQVLTVAEQACESIRHSGNVSDTIPVGSSAPLAASSASLPQRPSSKQAQNRSAGDGDRMSD